MGFSNNEHVLEVRQSSFLPKKKFVIPRRYAITTFNPTHIDYLHNAKYAEEITHSRKVSLSKIQSWYICVVTI